MDGKNPPQMPNLVGRVIILCLLLCVIFVVIFFGFGGKIWLNPPNYTRSEWIGSLRLPIFIVENEEEAKRLTEKYGIGMNCGVSASPKRDDIRIGLDNLQFQEEDGQYLIYGEIGWNLRPYRSFPGENLWVKTTANEILEKWDAFFKKNHPDVHYKWHPKVKEQIELELLPYRYDSK